MYIAMSLDGFLADENGGVDWISGDGSEPEAPGSYPAFYETVDTILLGWNTYHQIVTELSPDAWPYEGKTCYVLTHNRQAGQAEPGSGQQTVQEHGESEPDIRFYSGNLCALVQKLKAQEGRDIWICGGANVAAQLLEEDAIDRFHLTVIPVLLGKGIRLFAQLQQKRELRLIGTESYDGMTDLVFERR